MSKKSRKRNKKILSLLAAGLGAAALMKNKRNQAIDAGIQSAEDDSGSDMMEFKEQNVSPDTTTVLAPKINNSQIRTRQKIIDPDGNLVAVDRTNKMPNMAPPSIDNPYSSRIIRGRFANNRGLKSGGRVGLKGGGKVKGCGIAKKGFGRAMKKGGKK